MLLLNKKQWTIDVFNDMSESQNNAEWKKPDLPHLHKKYTLFDSIYIYKTLENAN